MGQLVDKMNTFHNIPAAACDLIFKLIDHAGTSLHAARYLIRNSSNQGDFSCALHSKWECLH